jgi:phosphoglycolate phosphatase
VSGLAPARPARLAPVRAVVFDLDGTLVDSLGDIAYHLNTALVESGYPARGLDEIRAWVGTGAERLVAAAVPDRARVPEVLARFRAHYRAAPYDRTRIYDGLPRVLDGLARAERALAVLSNKPHDLVVAIAERLLGRWPFRAIAGERADRPKKPDPGALVAVAGELGVPIEQCVLVGDSEIDVATARAAGAPCIAVAWGLRDREVLAAARPDVLVATPAELGELLSA